MKKISLFALVASLTLVFTSCSTNETTVAPEDQSLELLKSFKIKRDSNGAYTLDYSLNENVAADNVIDESTNTNNIYLYPSQDKLSRKVTQDLVIDGEQLKVGFKDAGTSLSNITIIDDNITLAKNDDYLKLKDYSIESNDDGTFTLDFTVKNKVKVDFVYNEEIETYEIHLEDGKSSEVSFTRILEKEEGKPLKFDFVNHLKNNNLAKGVDLEYSKPRKPRGIIL
ncbi:hypothetical protein DUT90_12055 [Polaribacter sp. WD7]|uniref:hypothetical protein n=1 Tax=Polaribacter sp. WD7 TaxID=2269061 RepID=UPI000DF263AD|nr:hypothetical protein [Polaribacter sp. WD7]RCS26484.1 hypothetical protein DUT90_12055 [Polaribacter sp. WD7]